MEAIKDYTEQLNEWEVNFVANIEDMFDRGFNLNEKQYTKLEQIYRRFY